MKFSEKLKELRLKKGLTQQQLAEKLYVSRSAVAKWEQGRGYPSLELLERLAEIFDFSIDNLLSEKEYHSMTIKSNQMAENQTKYNKIIAVICCVVIAIIGILVGLYLALKKDFQQKVQFEEYAFCSIEIEKEGLTLTCVEAFHATCNVSKGYKFFLNNEQKRNLTVYNKLGNYSTVESLRSGYIGKFSFYSENDDKPQNIVGYRFDIIEDYVEGDYNINGFFFSTEPVEYPQAPIYTGKNDEVLEYLGEEESLGQRYPAFIAYSDGLQSWGNHIQLKNSETLFYSKILEYTPIYKQYSFDINVSNLKDLYIYALDNSEKGYSLATIIEKPTNGGTLLGKVFHLEGGLFKRNAETNKDVRIPKKIIVDFRISVNFYKNISSVKIMEFNKNRTCVQTIIYTDFSEIPYMYMTADETRYVKCITYEKNDNISHEYSIAARGDELKMLLETYYGFIYEKKIKFY